MAQVVIYRDGHICFAKDIYTMQLVSIRTPLDYWVCKQGLVIWTNKMAPALLSFLDGERSGVKGTMTLPKGMLIDLQGQIHQIEVTLQDGYNGADDERYECQYPTGAGVQWVYSADKDAAERADACLLLGKDLAEVKSLMIKADVTEAMSYQWYKMEDLMKQIHAVHKKKYPDHEIHNIPETLKRLERQIESMKVEIA